MTVPAVLAIENRPNVAHQIGSLRGNICYGGKGGVMKNPLDSLGQTVLLGFVLTVIVVILVKAIS
jgi:hypothetical protein